MRFLPLFFLFCLAPAVELKLVDLQQSLLSGTREISGDIGGLTGAEKILVYQNSRKSPWGPFLLNWTVGFGIGSYVQKDTTGGGLGLVGDLGGITLMATGFLVELGQPRPTDYALGFARSYSTGLFHLSTPAGILVGSGALLMVVSRVFQMLRPFSYSEIYNQRLTQFLLNGGTLNLRF